MIKNYFHTKMIFLFVFLTGTCITALYAQCSFTGLNPNYCVNSATSALSSTTTGGTFSGPGIVGSTFNPAIAGPGTHSITYGICSSTYAITGGTGTAWYSPMPFPTVTTGPETPTSVTLSDDQVTANALNIGFTFQYFCTAYTSFYISSNGFITLSAGQPNGCCSGQSMPDPTTPNNVITLTWEDWNPGAGGTIAYATVGTAPNRVLLVNFTNVPHFGSGGGPLTAQLQLFETTNVIEIHTSSMITDGGFHTMGIENSGGSSAYVVAGRNASSSWSASNEMYRFTPGISCSSTQTTVVSPSTITVVGNSSICVGSSASLTATGNTTYTWSTSSNANNIVVTPVVNTTYSVSGTNAFGCVANSAITVTVDNTPTVTANSSNGTSGACPGKTVSLNGGGATSYTWTGGISNGVAFIPSSTGTYVVSGGNACGTSSAAITVSVHPLPSVSGIASSPTVCSGVSTTLTGVGTATGYVWTGGVTNGVGFAPTISGNYTVTGTSALTCTAAAIVGVTVVSTPSATPISSPTLICIGKSSTLTATGATNYTWLPGNASTSMVVVSPTASINTYTIIRSNANCVTTQFLNVLVNQLPNPIAIANPPLVCAGHTTQLNAGGGLTYTWTAPNTQTFTGANPIVSPIVTSVYTVAAHDGTCVNTTTVQVNVDPIPVITIAVTSPTICNGQSVSMTASGGNNYTWTAGSNTTILGTNATFTDSPTIPISYNITADNSFSCNATVGQIIIVYPVPSLSVAVSKTLVCSGGLSTFTVSGANTYTWDANAGNVTTSTASVYPTGTTIYTVQGSYSSTGCKSSKTAQVKVYTPTLTVTNPTNTCYGGTITLAASGGSVNTYKWYDNTGLIGSFQSVAVSPTALTVYTLNATSTPSNGVSCPGTQTTSVGIFYNPTVTASPQRTYVCKGETVDLYGHGATTYSWSNTMNGGTITVNPTSTTVYTVTGTDANGCVASGVIQVKISNCVGIEEQASISSTGIFVYPNPNNGNFKISSDRAIELKLVNDLGQFIRMVEIKESGNFTTDISDLAKGVYFISGEKDGMRINQKIIVTK